MPEPDARPSGTLAPVAVVWCRQVDNEAESPGYTTIPEEFPGRRETLETIRIVGNLTINVADTHDYWDPDPGQPLSYYPNLFLYPAAGGRHTCVGRMFLSTEDRPRLGMKTLVFDTAQLVATGEFGAAVLRAHASMGGRTDGGRVAAEPELATFQAVGEGFLFHRGTTEPVVLVAADQWEVAGRVTAELVRLLPTSLVALGAFLAFPYFLPEAKVNLHEFAEQLPLALAIMRVPRAEAQGERHAKRLQSWEAAPVTLRDLTRSAAGKGKEALPLVLQYARDHAEDRLAEVARRVDLVELGRTRAALDDPERQSGRDRRKEMWRIGTAMESAALLLARPKGRAIPMTGEAAKRANEYLQARPTTSPAVGAPDLAPVSEAPAVASALVAQLPPWLQRGTEVTVPPPGPVAVPVSVTDDPSTLRAPPPPPLAPSAPVATPTLPSATEPELEAWLQQQIDARFRALAERPALGTAPASDARWAQLQKELEAQWTQQIDTRVREVTEVASRAILGLQSDLGGRLNAVEARPAVSPSSVTEEIDTRIKTAIEPRLAQVPEQIDARVRATVDPQFALVTTEIEARVKAAIEPRLALLPNEIEARARAAVEPRLAAVPETIKEAIRGTSEMWATELKLDLHRSLDEVGAQSARAEEELRAALVAQLEIEVRESKEQAISLREEIEGRVRELLKERLAEIEARRTKDVRDLDQRLTLLLEGRTKDGETRFLNALQADREKTQASFEERVGSAERRLGVEQEARASELAEAQSQTLAGFQVRMQSFFEQKLRENQDREREKYVELLARFKGEVDQSLARTIDSTKFDAAVRERVGRILESARAEQEKAIAAGVADAELRLRSNQEESVVRLERVESKLQQRETDLVRVERDLRHSVEEMDRRVEVLTDRMLPLVRKTWIKVAELEKESGAGEAVENRLKELRREMSREIRRIEGEMLEQTTELRDRLESTITAQGRIWLNFVRQLSAAGASLVPDSADAPTRPSRRIPRAAMSGPDDDAYTEDLRASAGIDAFAEDPPNPMDPEAANGNGGGSEETPLRRRPRRS
jgi:hypothetical protein